MKIANVASSFIDKEVSFTSIAQGDIHPGRAGYAAMGKAYALAVWGDYLVVKPRESRVSVTIALKGKVLCAAISSAPTYRFLCKINPYVPLRSITDAIGAVIKRNALHARPLSVMLQNSTSRYQQLILRYLYSF